MMRKVWPVLLAAVLVLGFAMLGCGGGLYKAPAEQINVKFGADKTVVKPGINGTIAYIGDTGYTYTYGDNYGNGIVRFKVDLGEALLRDYSKVTFTWTGVSGNAASYANLFLLASGDESALTPWKGDGDVRAVMISARPTDNDFHNSYDGVPMVNGTDPVPVELKIVTTDANFLNLTGEVWFSIYMHKDAGAYSIKDVKLILK